MRLTHHQHLLTFEHVLRYLCTCIEARRGLPFVDVCQTFIMDHPADVVGVTHGVEVIVEVSNDQHNDEVGDYVELREAVR